jgi:hypothetical protein
MAGILLVKELLPVRNSLLIVGSIEIDAKSPEYPINVLLFIGVSFNSQELSVNESAKF